MTRRFTIGLMLLCLNFLQQSVQAENWLNWRGPNLNGSTSQAGLPEKLDPDGNVVWKLDLPGYGSSTPIIFEDRLFITSQDDKAQKLVALCLDNKTGKAIWRREMGEGSAPNARGNNTATPSPITDGKTVWFYFGSGELAAFDMDGKPLWSRNLVQEYGPLYIKWTYSSSPLLHFGKLYVQAIIRDVPPNGPRGNAPLAESYLLALDPATGKNLFRQVRMTEAQAETKESYATPLPFEGAGRKEIILIGGDWVTGHDAETGKEFWRLGGWNKAASQNFRVVASPVVLEDKVVICTPHAVGFTIAIKPGGSGDITPTHKLWESSTIKTDVPSPFVYKGQLFILDGDFKKGVSCVDSRTGEARWFAPIASRPVIRSSATAADGKIYVMNEDAEVWVLSATDGKILSNTTLANQGTARATIVPAQGRVFVRTGSTLYCFGTGKQMN